MTQDLAMQLGLVVWLGVGVICVGVIVWAVAQPRRRR